MRPREAGAAIVHPRLISRTEDGRRSFFTEAVADPPGAPGETLVYRGGRAFRRWEPTRSKLAAAIVKGFADPLPQPGDRWLYLGAAAGTTAGHVADLVGPTGAVFAVEKSVRSFARLLATADRFPNLVPLLADASAPRTYGGFVPPVQGLYADLSQPDQVAIAIENGRAYLRTSGSALLALKTASMGRDRTARGHLTVAEAALGEVGEVEPPVGLEPFHRGHYLLGVRATRRWFVEPRASGRPPDGPPAGRGP